MIDYKCKVRRLITEFSENTEALEATYQLGGFDLEKFRVEFKADVLDVHMVLVYQIFRENIEFLEKYMDHEILWNFDEKSYFIEADAI